MAKQRVSESGAGRQAAKRQICTRRCLLKGCKGLFKPATQANRYCSSRCQMAARRWSRAKARAKYRASAKGKACRRKQSFRYRERRRAASDIQACEGDQRYKIPSDFVTVPGATRALLEPRTRDDGGSVEAPVGAPCRRFSSASGALRCCCIAVDGKAGLWSSSSGRCLLIVPDLLRS